MAAVFRRSNQPRTHGDSDKLRDGRKRHILTDTSGLLLWVAVTPANVHDSVAAPELIEAFMAEPGRLLKLIWADTAYQGPALAQAFAVGLESPTSGSVAVNGKPSAGHRRPLAEVGALLEARAVHTVRSARNHLLAMAATAGISTKRVDEVIGMVGLGDAAGRRAGAFPLGTGQRLGIASAPLAEPLTSPRADTSPLTRTSVRVSGLWVECVRVRRSSGPGCLG